MERSIQQELKRRTVKVRVFPGEDALLRLVSAVLVEIDEKWASRHKGLHQVGMPGCMIRSQQNFQTKGCSIGRRRGARFNLDDDLEARPTRRRRMYEKTPTAVICLAEPES